MEQNIDLKAIERKTWLAAAGQDGLMDLVIGVLMLGMGLPLFFTDWLGPPWRSMAIPGFALAIFFFGKFLIVRPRIGKVKFGRERQLKRMKLFLFIAAVIVLQIALILAIAGGGLAGAGETLGGLAIPIGIGLTAFIIMAAIAYSMNFAMFYVYGALIGIGIPMAEVLYKIVGSPLNGIIAFGVPAIFVIAYGTIRLGKFVKSNPLPKEAV